MLRSLLNLFNRLPPVSLSFKVGIFSLKVRRESAFHKFLIGENQPKPSIIFTFFNTCSSFIIPTTRPHRLLFSCVWSQPRIFKDNTGFLKFLEDENGKGTREFWISYEEDEHQEERKKMGSEGPIEMSDRFAHFINVLGRYARLFHSRHKERPERLIIWVVSHYDTITAFFKNHVAGIPQKEYIPVDHDGGISLLISPENKASITVEGINYPIELTSRGTSLARTNKDK